MKSSTTNEVLLEDNGQPVLHKSVMTPDDELYLKVNNDKLQFKHQISDAFVDLSTTLDLPEIVQVSGTSTDKVMSQKAVTDVINENVNRIDAGIGSLDATKADADSVVNKTDIVQSTGSSETKVMSQKAVTNMLAQKASYSSLLNLGSSVSTIKNTTIPELRKVVDDNKLEVDRTTADLTEKINTINDTTIPEINKTITDNVSRIDGDIGSLDATKADAASVVNKTDIVHQPGTANDKVMSQNTTTYNLNLKVDKTAIVQTTGNATDKIMSQDAVTKALAASSTGIKVVQTTGTSQTDVMSQKAVTDQVNLKLDKTALASLTGNGTDVTMTQKAITEFVNNSIDSVDTRVTNLTNVVNRIDTDLEKSKTDIVAVTNTATRNETRIGNLDTEIQKINTALLTRKDVLNIIYPVGSFYISSVATSPASIVGGTWEQIQGKFLLAVDSTHAVGTTGGESTHVLTTTEMPIHNHSLEYKLHAGWDGTSYSSGSKNAGSSTSTWTASSPTSSDGNFRILNTGGGAAHNNMPPYLAVYIWKRTV